MMYKDEQGLFTVLKFVGTCFEKVFGNSLKNFIQIMETCLYKAISIDSMMVGFPMKDYFSVFVNEEGVRVRKLFKSLYSLSVLISLCRLTF